MGKYQLLSVFQFAIIAALVIIGATTLFALEQDKRARTQVQGAFEPGCPGVVYDRKLPDLYSTGKSLWNANGCGSCHSKSMKDNATGPALGGVEQRWAGEPREHLYRWVRQSQALLASGESERARTVWNEWEVVMSNYTHLSDDDVEALLDYIEGQYQ